MSARSQKSLLSVSFLDASASGDGSAGGKTVEIAHARPTLYIIII
jgi:hypothetical protein